ncbi:ABC-2 type transport system ATP-binding protein [Salirhabdus euzebyi]|uniref:ABC-2 type transport system ATP-binding protein n=1 Tax=Salirhabdus euzebyi TaxID=394506 RepID=A0A841Q6L6_9BACI|nr:ABC transporter ATP-binding protein [Salirhabdus euzebyi]MBB6454060.1 ABC-2 type transport system ATP-binding protein [Salirhabdus euzebyi]
MAIVEVNKLTKLYKGNVGIKNVSFDVNEGETFGFIGPNGAGKSTTIRTLFNFIYPTSGSAKIFGKDIVTESKEIRKHIGYLPSEVHYYENMKVEELLSYSMKFYKVNNTKRMIELAERLDLDLKRKIEDLSFGNRKKVGIVQALIHEPKLLIMDEPTGGLDPLMQNEFYEILAEEKAKGTTIFFSSHILSEVQQTCDRVAIIKDGEIVAVETIENLIKNSVKTVTLTLKEPENISLEIEGVLKEEVHGQRLSVLYQGNMKHLLNELNRVDFDDILIEEPSLEDVFLHYYEKDGGLES